MNKPIATMAVRKVNDRITVIDIKGEVTAAAENALMDAYTARQPAANPEGLSSADGECSRAKLLKLLDAKFGAPIGYKAGLTNPAVQKRFNHDEIGRASCRERVCYPV